jgi:predicted unusual protein kinase regulating ubiquinone biosynthesis (AarF/ABC1/UbiB family)
MWLWELLAGVEQRNPQVLALAARLKIDPAKVGRRLLWMSFWSWHESLFFLADPHPNTIIVGEGGKLAFIDFRSTGAMDRTKRRALQDNLYYVAKRDPLNMARVTITLLEPLPPLDVGELTKDLEAHNWQLLYALDTKGVRRPWYERTTIRQWSALAKVAQKFNIVIDTRVLRLLRASIMHETLAVRLDESLDIIKEYERFKRNRAARATRRTVSALARRIGKPADKGRYLMLEQVVGTAESLMFRLQHVLMLPRVNYYSMVGKSSYSFVRVMKFVTQAFWLTAIATGFVVAIRYPTHRVVAFGTAVGLVLSSRLFQAAVAFLFIANARALLFRIEDTDV